MRTDLRTLALLALSICCSTHAGIQGKAAPRGRKKKMPHLLQRSASDGLDDRPSTINCTWKYFTQPLDHFSPGAANGPNGTTMTFQQRYCLYDKFFSNHKASSTDAPPPNILFYTGNESPVEEYVNQTGLMWTLAPKLNSLVVFAEHRYFGKSVPQLKGVRNCLFHI